MDLVYNYLIVSVCGRRGTERQTWALKNTHTSNDNQHTDFYFFLLVTFNVSRNLQRYFFCLCLTHKSRMPNVEGKSANTICNTTHWWASWRKKNVLNLLSVLFTSFWAKHSHLLGFFLQCSLASQNSIKKWGLGEQKIFQIPHHTIPLRSKVE